MPLFDPGSTHPDVNVNRGQIYERLDGIYHSTETGLIGREQLQINKKSIHPSMNQSYN